MFRGSCRAEPASPWHQVRALASTAIALYSSPDLIFKIVYFEYSVIHYEIFVMIKFSVKIDMVPVDVRAFSLYINT